MTLHLFVNTTSEILVHAFHGSSGEAERFMKHTASKGQPAYHIRVEAGKIVVADEIGVVVK